jgi:hypothetical protein
VIFIEKLFTTSYQVPTLVDSDGHATGGTLTGITGTVVGDFIIGLNSTGSTSIPTEPTGYTPIGAGIASDESGNDCAIICSAKFVTSPNESVPAAGSSRSVFAAFRGVDPNILADLTNKYVYRNTSGTNNWGPPGIPVFARNSVVVAFGRRGGTSDTLFTNLTQIILQSSASAPAQIYWTVTEVASFADDVAYTITASSARASMSFRLDGAEA